jgi:hypothetical protein
MDDMKKQPEETKDVPLPEPELEEVVGGLHDINIVKQVDKPSPQL